MTTMILVVTAIIFLVMAGGIFFQLRASRLKVAAVRATPTSSAARASSMTPGELVEVTGTLRCESPITSELSNEPCVFYQSELIRHYEAHERSGNSSRWTKRTQSLATHSQRTAFVVEDAMGSVRVDPEGADIDGLQVVDRFEQEPGAQTMFGGTVIELGGFTLGGQRTLGYRHIEHILRPDESVYVLGVVHEDHSIGCAPSDVKDKPFVISYRSEDELTQHLVGGQKSLKIWCGICAAVGVALLVVAVVMR